MACPLFGTAPAIIQNVCCLSPNLSPLSSFSLLTLPLPKPPLSYYVQHHLQRQHQQTSLIMAPSNRSNAMFCSWVGKDAVRAVAVDLLRLEKKCLQWWKTSVSVYNLTFTEIALAAFHRVLTCWRADFDDETWQRFSQKATFFTETGAKILALCRSSNGSQAEADLKLTEFAKACFKDLQYVRTYTMQSEPSNSAHRHTCSPSCLVNVPPCAAVCSSAAMHVSFVLCNRGCSGVLVHVSGSDCCHSLTMSL